MMITLPSGLKLFVRDTRASHSGLPIVCLPGLTRNSLDFEGITRHLTDRRVVAIDMRGRGRSDYDFDPLNYNLEIYAADTLFVMDFLHIEKAIFIGTSMGGLVTMQLAATAPERVVGAVLNDIGPEIDRAGLVRLSGYVGKIGPFESWDFFAAAMQATSGQSFPKWTLEDWHAHARRVARERPDGKVELAYDPKIAHLFLKLIENLHLLPSFTPLAKKPVLVIRAALSDLLSQAGVDTLLKLKPDLDFTLIPDVGHSPTLDEPEAISAIQSFLAQRF